MVLLSGERINKIMFELFKNKRDTTIALAFGIPFCFINLLGKYLESHLTASFDNVLFVILNTIFFSPIVGEIYLRLRKYLISYPLSSSFESEITLKQKYIYFLICVVCMNLAYIPVLLAYYPGLFAYDVAWQISQSTGGFYRHHPLIHTLYLQFFYYIVGEKCNNYTVGIACASAMQMFLFTMMVSYIHLFLYTIGVNVKIRRVLLALSSLLPYFSVLSISMTKDVFFTGFMGILCVCLFYWEKYPPHYNTVGNIGLYIISVIGVILFRNNGIFAVVMSFGIGTGILVIKRKNFKYLWSTLTGIILALIISEGLSFTLSAGKGSGNEALSLPYQQISYVYHAKKEELSNEELSEILEIIPTVENYNPHLSDPVKGSATGNQNLRKLFSCYIRLFQKYPLDYFQAFLQHNLGYFYIGDKTHAAIYGTTAESRQGYLLTDTKDGFGVIHVSRFSALEKLYEYLYTTNKYQELFILRLLCSPATYFWMILLLFTYVLDMGRRGIVTFTLIGFFILTLLAGPCVLIRYAFPYIVCIPILLTMILSDKNYERPKEENG